MNYSPKGGIFASKREQCALIQANISTGTHVLLEMQSIHFSNTVSELLVKSF